MNKKINNIEIVYEDDDLIVINKPKNILVHPTTYNEPNTIVDALKDKINVSEFTDQTRPGIIQRLDKNTTIFLYGLRLKFDEDRESVKLNTDTIVNVSDIIKTLIDVGAYNKKPSDFDIKNALSNLIKFNIIQKIDGKLEDPETKIIILPSILFAITNERITALSQAIGNLEENEEDDETENEDEEEDSAE